MRFKRTGTRGSSLSSTSFWWSYWCVFLKVVTSTSTIQQGSASLLNFSVTLLPRKHAKPHNIPSYRRHILTLEQHSFRSHWYLVQWYTDLHVLIFRLTILNLSAVLDQIFLIFIQYFYVSANIWSDGLILTLSSGSKWSNRKLQSVVVGQLPGHVLHLSQLPHLPPHLKPVSPADTRSWHWLSLPLVADTSSRSCSPTGGI